MKKLSKNSTITLGEYDVKVNRYLTYAQIQHIVNSVKNIDMWAEYQQDIDMLVLYYATDIGEEMLEKCGHDLLLKSGLINAVKSKIYNLNDIQTAMDYTLSEKRSLNKIICELYKSIDNAKGVAKHDGGKAKK